MEARTNLVENVEHLIARLIGGMQVDIKENVKLRHFELLIDGIIHAERMKELNKVRSKKNARKSPWNAS